MVWWIGICGVLAALLVLAVRRSARRGHGDVGHDLFEGILPGAITGSSSPEKRGDGWELRWTDVANLTPAGTEDAADPEEGTIPAVDEPETDSQRPMARSAVASSEPVARSSS